MDLVSFHRADMGPVIPAPGNLMPSSGLFGYQTQTQIQCTYRHVDKTLIRIKIFFEKKKKRRKKLSQVSASGGPWDTVSKALGCYPLALRLQHREKFRQAFPKQGFRANSCMTVSCRRWESLVWMNRRHSGRGRSPPCLTRVSTHPGP